MDAPTLPSIFLARPQTAKVMEYGSHVKSLIHELQLLSGLAEQSCSMPHAVFPLQLNEHCLLLGAGILRSDIFLTSLSASQQTNGQRQSDLSAHSRLLAAIVKVNFIRAISKMLDINNETAIFSMLFRNSFIFYLRCCHVLI
jgi:hypothetical protein